MSYIRYIRCRETTMECHALCHVCTMFIVHSWAKIKLCESRGMCRVCTANSVFLSHFISFSFRIKKEKKCFEKDVHESKIEWTMTSSGIRMCVRRTMPYEFDNFPRGKMILRKLSFDMLSKLCLLMQRERESTQLCQNIVCALEITPAETGVNFVSKHFNEPLADACRSLWPHCTPNQIANLTFARDKRTSET